MRNDPVEPAVRARAVAAAQGREPFDLLLAGGTVVDVGCGELRAADVGIVGSVGRERARARIADRRTRRDRLHRPIRRAGLHRHARALRVVDAHARADTRKRSARGARPPCSSIRTSSPTSPGVAGVRYAVEASRGLPVRFIVQAPSCVPPQPGLELSGADLYGPDITEMLSWDEVGGLAEVMDMIGVLGAADRMVDVVAAGIESGKLVSGHAAGLTGPVLQAYLAAGMTSDHEIFTEPDCLEKLRAGMTVELRGMIDEILPAIVAEVKSLPLTPTHLVAATDDLFALTLLNDGGIDHLLRRLVAYGLDAVLALRFATYNAAYRLQRADLGLVAAGRRADVVVLTDLESFPAEHVITDGNLVASHGRMLAPVRRRPERPATRHDEARAPRTGRHAVAARRARRHPPHARHRRRGDDALGRDRRRRARRRGRGARRRHRAGDACTGTAASRPSRTRRCSRAGANWTGAVATTVAHDTHNLVVFGRDPHDMALAANTVIATGGGLAVVRAGEVLAQIALPIAGILSPLPPAELAAVQKTVQDAAIEIGLVRADAHPAPLPGDAVVAGVPARPARHRCRPHRRHDRRSRRHRPHLLISPPTVVGDSAVRAEKSDNCWWTFCRRVERSGEPGGDAGAGALLDLGGRARRVDRAGRDVRERGVVEPECAADQLVLLERLGPKRSGSSELRLHRTPGGEERGQRVRRDVGDHGQHQVRGRAHVEAHGRVGQPPRRARGPRSPGPRAGSGRRPARRARPAPTPGRRARPRAERAAARRPARSRTRRRTARAGSRPRRWPGRTRRRPGPRT